jgi:UDP-glucuronate decarboxylase
MTPYCLSSDIEEIVARLGDGVRELEGRSIVLAGGAGFLGRYFVAVFSHLNRHLLKHDPVAVTVIDNMITAGPFGEQIKDDPSIAYLRHDVIRPVDLAGDIHYVIHAAGIASPFYYRRYPLETLDVAIAGTRNLLELTRRKQARCLFFSSSEVYGDPDPRHVPTRESYRGNVASMGPRACYDEAKRIGETLCYVYHEHLDTATNCVRPFNVYGPGMQETDYRVMPNFAHRIKARQPLLVYGTGLQTRTFCYVTDAMVGFFLTLLRGVPGHVYNIGTPAPEVTIMQLAETMGRVLGRRLDLATVEHPDSYPADEPQRRCPDIEKARKHLDFEPTCGLEEGLRRFLSWADEAYTGVT